MKRVKRFFQVAKAILQLVSKLLPLVGDVVECIKVVDSLVDSFIEKRKNGELKDVDVVTYISEVLHLVGEIAPLGYSFVESIELLVDYAHKFGTNLRENGSSLGE